MSRALLRRLWVAVPTVLLVLTVTFFGLHLAPGDPVRLFLGPSADEAAAARPGARPRARRPVPGLARALRHRRLGREHRAAPARDRGPGRRLRPDAAAHRALPAAHLRARARHRCGPGGAAALAARRHTDRRDRGSRGAP